MGEGYSFVERDSRGVMYRANLYGSPGRSEDVGRSVTVVYEYADPSNMAREKWSFFNDVLSVICFMGFGGILLPTGILLKKPPRKSRSHPVKEKRRNDRDLNKIEYI